VPLTDYLGLGIVLFSYAGTLCWGFNADWDLVPDLDRFVAATEESFRELRAAAAQAEGLPASDEDARVAAIEAIARGGTARETGDGMPAGTARS
jgi:hypothetical protein